VALVHGTVEWLKFLRLIEQTIPPDRQLHLICDNYATHKHPKVQRLAGTASALSSARHSYQRLLARPFRDLTQNRLRRGVF
jgi:hypothetical protein